MVIERQRYLDKLISHMNKVCRNNNSIFWTMWDEFNPYNEEHQKLNDVVFVESECLKWRVIK